MAAVTLSLGELNPKQKLFCQSRAMFTAYGGARGGGKTHVLRIKALLGAIRYPGLRVLIVRREYPELEQSIILPMRRMVPRELATYQASLRMLFFTNGSTIKFGHYGAADSTEYQGQEYDWIFLEEATQFTESEFRTLGACLRGSTAVPRRMYLTCNPGGVGHGWVKRLFISRRYLQGERGEDYAFIPATVEDNPQLLEGSPGYTAMLDMLPEDVRRAWRYGDWDALSGAYFPELSEADHLYHAPLPTPVRRYRAFDYGLDMFACLWIAVDRDGKCYVYREVRQSGLVVSQAAALALELTPEGEEIEATFAPPDMWSRVKESGKTMAELFAENGLTPVRSVNSRIHGWMALKELLRGRLVISEACRGLFHDLAAIQRDGKNPSDCALTPHDITHSCDALRYFAVMHTAAAETPREERQWEETGTDYDEAMTGGEAEESYWAL